MQTSSTPASVAAQVPEVNSSWLTDSIRAYQYIDINVSMGVADGEARVTPLPSPHRTMLH